MHSEHFAADLRPQHESGSGLNGTEARQFDFGIAGVGGHRIDGNRRNHHCLLCGGLLLSGQPTADRNPASKKCADHEQAPNNN